MFRFKQREAIHKSKGFTLLETMLVIAVIGGIILLGLNYSTRTAAQGRLDKTALQMQQILNAGIAYYNTFGQWPTTCNFNSSQTSNSTAWDDISGFYTAGYLPSTMATNPYGNGYNMTCDSNTGGVFYAQTQPATYAEAMVLAGELPVAYLSDQFGNPTTVGPYVTAQVTIPGQNLNNARSVNFSGIYHNGACVPVPNCPNYNTTSLSCTSGTNCMTPQIMVVPVSISGVNSASSNAAYPIASFTAYAYGPATKPKDCATGTNATSCSLGTTGIASPNTLYWRVCAQVVTQQGSITSTNTTTGTTAWGQYVSLMAITRCTPPSEPFGSDFTVYTR